MQNKKWKLRPARCGQNEMMELSRTYSIPPLVAAILLKRGIEAFDEFVFPELNKLHDPFLMRDMDRAVKRIADALHDGEVIAVYGDYDVDGITSTAILTRFLQARGARVFYYIPDRLKEGYGLNRQAIEKIAAEGAGVLITVDTGITAIQETLIAKEFGLDVIVTDHHECREELPEAVAVLNPKRPDCSYPYKQLAGVGVVFKLLQALATELRIHMQTVFDEYLDIAALGTIADVMPLTGENRILVKNGLNRMAYTENRGLCALIRQAEIDPLHITTGTVGFMLAPRINAAGRVGDPKCAVSLLLTDADKDAAECARRLNEANRERQATEQRIFEEAIAMLTCDKSFAADKVLVLSKSGWHHGIIGIVASKITERFHKPCILISLDHDMGKGSGRSIGHFNLFTALSACEDHLVKFGGHELAAGLTVCSDSVEAFRRAINAYAASVMQPEDAIPEIIIDAELPLSYMNLNTVDKFSVMAPYGMGNASPVFVCRGLRITGMRLLSEGKHLRLILSDGQYTAGAIGFSMGELAEELHPNDRVDIVFNLESNLYRGERQVQILLKDLRPSPPEHAISNACSYSD